MSWFTKYIEHPFVAAVQGLTSHPAIASNPAAAAAVADAKAQATTVASAVTAGAASVVADAAVVADPALTALTNGLTSAVDGFLLASLGPVGGEIVIAATNPLLALGEAKAHDLLTALFAHAKSQLPATQPAAPAHAA